MLIKKDRKTAKNFICNMILLLLNFAVALVGAVWFVKVLPEENAGRELLCFGIITLSSIIGVAGACIRIYSDRKK